MPLGAALAIFCAFTWSVSVILFKKAGGSLHPVALNLWKNGIALLLMIPTIYLAEGTFIPPVAGMDLGIMLLSGLLGIGVADAMVLKALSMVGATRIAIIECSYAPFVIVLSLLFLGEVLTPARAIGAALVVAALLCVSIKKEARAETNVIAGMSWGILGLFSMALGIVLIKPLFDRVPLFWMIGVRLGAGVVGSLVLYFLFCDHKVEQQAIRDLPRKGLVLFACVLSTYFSMMLWVAGYKYNDATMAAVLNQTSTIFTVVLATLFLKERFTPLKAAGTALALGGVLLITLS